MEMLTFKGIVIREYPVGESDRFIHVFTKEYGVIELMARGSRKMISKNAGASQLFAYSDFSVRSDKGKMYLDSSQLIHLFYDIRSDIKKLALADYISEIVSYAAGHNKQSDDIMRLFLNTLHFLSSGERDTELLKAIFEMRFMTEIGMMPDIVCCPVCMTYSAPYMLFDLISTKLYCTSCFKGKYDDTQITINDSTVHALRHIVFADMDRLFNFRLAKKSMEKLSRLTERYIIIHLGRSFKTLDYYNSL